MIFWDRSNLATVPRVPYNIEGDNMAERIKVLGGPGCGKSYTLMQKYTELCNAGYTPDDITLITFRRSSAADLIDSVTSKTGLADKVIKQHVGTIHSICWRLGGYSDVISGSDIDNFIKEYNYTPYMKIKSAASEEDSVYSGNLFDLYTWMRNTQTQYEKWMRYPGCGEILLPSDEIPGFLHNYDMYKQKISKIDYSDMIQEILTYKIDLDTPVLMIDEFQDLTSQMYKLFEMWVPNREFVMIAGDPFQSIYGFWGGSPAYFNQWKASEYVIGETMRLPEQVHLFASRILRMEGMQTPGLKAKTGYLNPIINLMYGDSLPIHKSELHLVRCNYQANAIAMDLAHNGKLFTGVNGWTADEITLANALLAIRSGHILNKELMRAIVSAYPVKMFGNNMSTGDLLNHVESKYIPELATGSGTITPKVLNSIMSDDPILKMKSNSKLLTVKMAGILNRKSPIMSWEVSNRKLLTIHGSKGLEADAVFLHTSITPRINKSIVIPGEESAAEARVWYVGSTRAKEVLYIVKDAGKNYSLPEVGVC